MLSIWPRNVILRHRNYIPNTPNEANDDNNGIEYDVNDADVSSDANDDAYTDHDGDNDVDDDYYDCCDGG